VNRRIVLAACGALFAAAPLAAQRYQGRDETTFTYSRRVSSGSLITIKSLNGPITVTSASGNELEIRAEKRMRGARDDARDMSFEVDESGDGVKICTVYRDQSVCDEDTNFNNVRMSVAFVVALPRGARLRAGTGNGEISVEGTGGDIDVGTGNGKVRVSGTSGTVRAATGNGEVSVDGARGQVRASTGNGRVYVSTSSGPVSVSTGNGDIDVRMEALSAGDDMNFSSGSGDIRLTLPADFNGEIDAGTGNGSLHSDFEIRLSGRVDPQHVRGTIGRGGRMIKLRSGNGALELRKG